MNLSSRIIRGMIVVVAIYACVMAVLALQYLFDRGDLKKASTVLYEFQPPGHAEPLLHLIAKDLGLEETSVVCESYMISRYEGRVGLDCGSVVTPEREYRFEADVVASSVRAVSEKARGVTKP